MKTPHVLGRCGLIVLALLSLQCGTARKGGSPEWGDAVSGFRLRYRFSEDAALRYRTRLSTESTQEVLGNEQVQQFSVTLVLTQKAVALPSRDPLQLQVSFDSVRVDAPGAAASMMQQGANLIVGRSLILVVSPVGEVVDVQGEENLPTLPGNQSATALMRNFFLRLPEHRVRPGDSWSVPPEEIKVHSGGVDLRIRTENQTFTVEGVEKRGAEDVLKISFRSTFSLSGNGDQMGATFDLSGSGETTGLAYFAYKRGVLLNRQADVTSDGIAEIVAPQTLTVPWHNVQRVTMDLLP